MSSIEVRGCQCPPCQAGEAHRDRRLHEQMNLLLSRLGEAERRWYAAVEANRLGHGGRGEGEGGRGGGAGGGGGGGADAPRAGRGGGGGGPPPPPVEKKIRPS